MLTEEETFSSFTAWQSRMKAVLRKDAHYTRFLVKGSDSNWSKCSEKKECRGLVDDTEGDKTKKEVKLLHLTGMLEEIAQWAPHYLTHDIVEESTSVESVWNIIRAYYQFQQNEVQFMSLLSIEWGGINTERPEHLYRRIISHIHDNLLKKDGQLKYNNQTPTEDEKLTPTVERLAILHWLQLIDPKLPASVIKSFSNELQTMTLKDLQPQISSSIPSLLEEIKQGEAQANFIKVNEDVQALKINTFSKRSQKPISKFSKNNPPKLFCRLCFAEGRHYTTHTMGTCGYIAANEKKDIVKTMRVEASLDDDKTITDEVEELDINDE